MLLRMIREIKMSCNRFGCVLVISFYVAKVFSDRLPNRLPSKKLEAYLTIN